MVQAQIEENKEQVSKVESHHKVSIQISCRNLVDLDNFGESDPFAKLYVKAEKDPSWQLVGQTEVIFNCLSPNFTKIFDVSYYFEKNQIIRVEIYDFDEDSQNELIGTF